ncbi:hypothetical protein WDW37_08960 [Bdellovibrionota bacterium FG-1]
MRIHTTYLLYQVSRFGVLRTTELESLCADKCGKTILYANLKELIQHRYIERFCHPEIYRTAYRATPIGVKSAFGRDSVELPRFRDLESKHALRVAQTLINLARFENVSGFATALELPDESMRKFSHPKVPDGIIQLSRGNASYEVAIEVEVTPKTNQRCDDFLDKYQEAFLHSSYCSGVIVVCDANDIYDRYSTHLEKRDESFKDRVLLIRGPGLESLNPVIYGTPRNNPGKCGELRRSHFGAVISYFPIVSANRDQKADSVPPQNGGQSEFLTNKEFLQPISHSGT